MRPLLPLLLVLAGCSPARAQEPLPDLGPTLAELDRIERGILVHEIAVRDWRAAK